MTRDSPILPPRRSAGHRERCGGTLVLILDGDPEARQRRVDCLRRWGHAVRSYAAPSELPPASQLPPGAVLIARQELSERPGIECIHRVQKRRSDIPAILVTDHWSASLAAGASSHRAIWLRKEPLSDEELHVLVDLCAGI